MAFVAVQVLYATRRRLHRVRAMWRAAREPMGVIVRDVLLPGGENPAWVVLFPADAEPTTVRQTMVEVLTPVPQCPRSARRGCRSQRARIIWWCAG